MLKVACLGAGYFAQFHYDSWARMPGATAVASCDNDLARAKQTGLRAYTDLALMLRETEPDILDVILPPTGHGAAIRTAVAAGVRTVICQKPFCQSLAEAEEITALAAQAGVSLIIHENFRFQPWYRTAKGLISEGAIGDVHQATMRLRPGDGQGPRAYLDRQPYFQTMPRFLIHETAVHWIDTFRYLFGPICSVYADLRQLNPAIAGEDAGFVLFEHASGTRSLFDGNRHLDHAATNHRLTMGEALFEGTKGVLSLTGDGALQMRPFGQTETRRMLDPDTTGIFGGDCVHALNHHVVSALTQGTALENTALDYLDVMRVEAAIYLSAETGQRQTLDLS